MVRKGAMTSTTGYPGGLAHALSVLLGSRKLEGKGQEMNLPVIDLSL